MNYAAKHALECRGLHVDLIVLNGSHRSSIAHKVKFMALKLARLARHRQLGEKVWGRLARAFRSPSPTTSANTSSSRSSARLREAKFAAFSENHLAPITLEAEDRESLTSRYHAFAVGGDQIWNYDYDLSPWHFLDFAGDKPRICLAPSVGHRNIPLEWRSRYRAWLSQFSEIAVREDEWVESLAHSSRAAKQSPQVTRVVDPTLLVTAEVWRNLARPQPHAGGKALVYTLAGLEPQSMSAVQRLCDGHGLGIDLLSPLDGGNLWETDAQDFLGMILQSECIITDSYHGALFAMQFEKPLVVVPRSGHGAAMNTRFDAFMQTFGLEDRLLSRLTAERLLSCEYQEALGILTTERERFNAYLDRALLSRHEEGK